MPSSSSLNVFIIGGTGLIGSSLRKMMTTSQKIASADGMVRIVLVGYCNSRVGVRMAADGMVEAETVSWCDSQKFNDDFIEQCVVQSGGPVCIADCTASEEVSDKYVSWLQRGWHVATPNKKCNSGPLERYQACLDACNQGKSKWYTEATIGAGLPIVSTLRTLKATGDEITQVQGIFSGTMSFLFNTWNHETNSFSSVVAQAKDAGYTEPDPREDLNGMDVARKVVIAARESGLMLNLDDVSVQSLVPQELETCSAEEFMQQFPKYDDSIAERARNAFSTGKVLRFVGAVNVGEKTATVQLVEMAKTHPFAGLSGADNILEIQTQRYGPNGGSTPLIIRGPGAGADVTAAGVLGDIVALANTL